MPIGHSDGEGTPAQALRYKEEEQARYIEGVGTLRKTQPPELGQGEVCGGGSRGFYIFCF